jgi:hypothetical protein
MAKGTKSGLNRRWFANMSGWGVSLQLGSGEPTKGKRSLAVSPESKFFASNLSITGALHNTLYSYNPLSVITQGTGANQRIGAGIKLKGISFKFCVETGGGPTTAWRVLLVASTYQGGLPNFGSVLNSGHLFYATTGLSFVNAHVDSRIAKVVCDEVIRLEPNGGSAVNCGFIDCVLDFPFEYQTTSSYGVNSNLYLVVVPHLPLGTNGVSNCGNIQGEVITCWTD